MRIFQITVESSCFSAPGKRQEFPEQIEQLIDWNNKGWVDLIKTDVLEKETDDLIGPKKEALREKTKSLTTDYGSNLIGHTHSEGGFDGRQDRLEEVYIALWGKHLWQEGLHENMKIRDAMHLDTHLINERDFFVTNERKHFLNKKDYLKEKLNVVVMNPKECLESIQEYWSNNPGSFPGLNQHLPLPSSRIIGGTCVMRCLNLHAPGEKTYFYISVDKNGFYYFQGILYDSNGSLLCEIGDKIIIHKGETSFHAWADPVIRQRILLEGKLYSRTVLLSKSERILEAKVLGDGSLWLFGKYYNETGLRFAYFGKDYMQIGPGLMNF